VLIPFLVALVPAAPIPKDAESPPVVCTVKRIPLPPELHVDGNYPDDGLWAEVTLTNRTKAPIEVLSRYEWKDRIYAKVTDSTGKEVSNPLIPYVYHSIQFPEQTLVLKPGDPVKVPIHLFGNTGKSDEKKPKPGKYKVTVIFESGKLRSEAAALEVEVK
jgi:hypothetical protein